MQDNKNRRRFLKNVMLGALSVVSVPISLKSFPTNVSKNVNSENCPPLTLDAYGQGPFYTANAPNLQNGQLADVNELGQRIQISGQVFNLECSEIIPNTEIDIWHADDSGEYDNFGYNLRGKVFSNNQGIYTFETIKPGFYLNGSTYRPSHIHFKITPPGFSSLITQLYFAGDPYIASDFAASMNSGVYDATHRIIPLSLNSLGIWEGTWDIIIDGNGISLNTDYLHLDKGMIYNVSPNPFNEIIDIEYGVFMNSDVKINVIDLSGNIIAELSELNQNMGKYSVSWKPESYIAPGVYFLTLKINDLQVHYIKIVKEI